VEEQDSVPTPRLYRRRRGAHGLIAAGIVLVVVVAAAIWFDRAIYAPVSTFTNGVIPTPTRVAAIAASSTRQGSSASAVAITTSAAPTPAPTATAFPSLGGTQRINILLLGSDTDAKFQGSFITQIMMVASIDPVHHSVSLLSIPRDFWVPIPGHGVGKIQVAYQFGEQDHPGGGGIALARQTIEDDFGIHIDHYAWIGLAGFIKVIDTAGGVDIDALHPILDDDFPDDIQANGQVTKVDIYASRRLYIPAGPQHMDGATALQYVRSRHADLLGDFGRSQRQQQVLLQLRKKVEQPAALLQIPTYLDDLNGYVKSDFSVSDLFAFGNFIREYGRQPYAQYVLMPPDYSSLDTITVGGLVQDIVRPNWPAVHALVAHVFAPPEAAAPPATPATGGAHIAVENGTTIGGLAGEAVTYLANLGYTVDPAADAANTNVAVTLVTVYNPAKRGIADMVAESFGAEVRTAPAGATHGADDIVVTLGQDHGTFEGF
jgi:LCP family protein required for cell wall assembly